MKKQAEITAAAIYRVTVKETGQECYAVPSDSQPGAFYLACYDEKNVRWTCTCKAGQNGCSNCKHIKAAQVSIKANKERHEEEAKQELAAVKEAERVVSEQAKMPLSPVAAKVQEAAGIRDAIGIGDKGNLSSNRGFSLLAR